MARQNFTPIDVVALASAPASPNSGWIYFDTTLSALRVYTGSAWVSLGSGGGTAGDATFSDFLLMGA
jgi:hypothetical protein